jgi:hypothetical protein
VRSEDEKLYKNKYVLAVYDRDDDTLKYLFDNLKELCEVLGLEVNRKNMNKVQVNVYRALKRPDHQTNLFRGRCYKIYIVDITKEED